MSSVPYQTEKIFDFPDKHLAQVMLYNQKLVLDVLS